MSMYLISYELKSEVKDYSDLYAAIKSIGDWQHPLDSIWFVRSGLKATAIYEQLKPHTLDVDNLLVAQVDISDMQGWLPKSFWHWIHNIIQNA